MSELLNIPEAHWLTHVLESLKRGHEETQYDWELSYISNKSQWEMQDFEPSKLTLMIWEHVEAHNLKVIKVVDGHCVRHVKDDPFC